MTYEIIQPPFTLKFREMSRKELDDYFQWFLSMIPDRIAELAKAVQTTPGFEEWQPDRTPASLDSLGEWLYRHVESRPRTDEEIQEIALRSSFPIGDPGEELTNRTFSLAVDTGIYLSQVFLNNHPSLRWSQEFGDKQFVDYGQPVLAGFRPSPFNPVRMMVTLAYGLVRKSKDGRRLRGLYDYWIKNIVS
jgi:hypothetical protein